MVWVGGGGGVGLRVGGGDVGFRVWGVRFGVQRDETRFV